MDAVRNQGHRIWQADGRRSPALLRHLRSYWDVPPLPPYRSAGRRVIEQRQRDGQPAGAGGPADGAGRRCAKADVNPGALAWSEVQRVSADHAYFNHRPGASGADR